MSMSLRLGLGLGARRSGAGGGGVALAISDLVVDTAVDPDEITLTANGPGTLYWVVTASATTPSSAQIIAGQTHTGAAASAFDSFAIILGETTDNPDFSGLAAGTWYLHCVLVGASETSNTLTSASFTIAASFTAAWQQFDGSAWLEKNSDMTGMPTNSAGYIAAITYQPSAGDAGAIRELLIALSTTNYLINVAKGATEGIAFKAENTSDTALWNIGAGAGTLAPGSKYLILCSLAPAGVGAKAIVIRLDTGAVHITGTDTDTGTLGGPSSTGWIIGAASGTGTRATSGQLERVMFWPNTYADAGNATVQGYFHASGVLKDPAVAVAALGTPHIQIVGASLQTGANAGSGGAFAKDGAGSIVPA